MITDFFTVRNNDNAFGRSQLFIAQKPDVPAYLITRPIALDRAKVRIGRGSFWKVLTTVVKRFGLVMISPNCT